MIGIKLWKFSLPDLDDCLYLYSLRRDEYHLRHQLSYQDHGGMDESVYIKLYKHGKIELITNVNQVKEEDRQILPYSDEEISSFEMDIDAFFDPPIIY